MIFLTTTGQSLEIVLAGTVATNELQFVGGYITVTPATPTVVPVGVKGVTTGTTPATLVPAPASGKYNQVKWLSIYNEDTASATVIIQFQQSGATKIITVVLEVGSTLQYADGEGFSVMDAAGNRLIKQSAGLPSGSNYEVLELDGSNALHFTSALHDAAGVNSVDFANRALYQSSGLLTVDYDAQWLKASDGTLTVNWGEYKLLDPDGISLNWDTRLAYDAAANMALDWDNRLLRCSDASDAVNWENRRMYSSDTETSVDWENRELSQAGSGALCVQWNDRYLSDGTNPSVNWGTRILYDANNFPSVDWNNRNITDSTGVTSFYYDLRHLTRTNGSSDFTTIDFQSGLLIADDNFNAVDWYGRKLIGNDGSTAVADWHDPATIVFSGSIQTSGGSDRWEFRGIDTLSDAGLVALGYNAQAHFVKDGSDYWFPCSTNEWAT